MPHVPAERMPVNVSLEQALLGAMLVNNDAYGYAAGNVSAEDFSEPVHRAIFAECSRQIIAGKKVSPVTLQNAFPDIDIGGITTSEYLARLAAEATTVLNAVDYAKSIRELATMRAIIEAGKDLARAQDQLLAPDVALEQAWDRLDQLRSKTHANDDGRGPLGAHMARLIESTTQILEGNTKTVPTTGYTDVDKQFGGGYRPGRLLVMAGRPGMGKTVVLGDSARRVARAGFGAGIFSLEIDGSEMSSRIIASEMAKSSVPIDYRDILTGNLNPLQLAKVKEAAARMKDLPLHVDATGGLTFFEIKARSRMMCERWKQKNVKPGVIFIDYLGLISASDRYRGQRVNELGEIAKAAKDMSKELQVAVVLMAQLNRAVESRDDKRPTMSDLRDSGQIEEHADVVCLLYRPHYYDQRGAGAGEEDVVLKMEQRKHDLDLLIGKNRLGPTVPVRLWCDVAKSALDNYTRYQ